MDDGRQTGRVWSDTAHMVAAVIGSGVLSSAWAFANLGLIAGLIVIFLFFSETYYTSSLLIVIYFESERGTYLDLIRRNLSCKQGKVCVWVLHISSFASAIGCQAAAFEIIMEMAKLVCLHASGGSTDRCQDLSYILYMSIAFVIIQIIISMVLRPRFKQTWYSIIFGGMFCAYGGISIFLSVCEVVANGKFKGSLAGRIVSKKEGNTFWQVLEAIGVIVLACSYYPTALIETLGSVNSEAQTMKKATPISVTITAIIYMLWGCMGYAAFGSSTPEDLLLPSGTSIGRSGFYWLLVGNAARLVHLMCAYQAYCQPIYDHVEKLIDRRLVSGAAAIGFIIRLVWETVFVAVTGVVSILILPFFKDVVGLIGALSFWCLVVYFPVEMHISQKKIAKCTGEWVKLQALNVTALVSSLAVAVAYGHAIPVHLKTYRPFMV